MTRFVLIAAVCIGGCSKDPGTIEVEPSGRTCEVHSDCGAAAWCVSGRCVAQPEDVAPPPDPAGIAAISATPASLNFGSVSVGELRTLSLVVANVGEAMVTLNRVAVAPHTAPFRVEPMGYGPFWIRQERSRELFITYAPTAVGSHQARLLVGSEAPLVEINLTGN